MKRQQDDDPQAGAEGEDDGSWIPGGGSAAQRRRRDLVSRACEPCRRSKTKCDEQRPCARCTSRRTISQCLGKVPLQSVNGYVECPNVERPLSYDGTQYLSGDMQRAPGQKSPWDLIPTMEAGWSDEAVGAIFENMPQSLRNNLMNGLRMLEGFRQQSSAFFDKVPVADNGMSMSAVEGIERQMWNAVPTTGIMQVSLDPISGQRRAIFMNQRFASIFGYHREELLTRMVQREVPMAMSPLEFICLMIDEIQNGMSVSCDRVLRIFSEMNDGAIFVKHLQHKSFDRFGRLIKVTLYYDTVDSAALDVIRNKHPALARPFSNHLGDMRSGAELLAQARSDLDVTINEIERSSEAGARLVRELENLLAMTLEPFAHAAAHLDNLMRMAGGVPPGRFGNPAMGGGLLPQPHGPAGTQHPQQHPGQAPPNMQAGANKGGAKGKNHQQNMAQQPQPQRMGPGGPMSPGYPQHGAPAPGAPGQGQPPQPGQPAAGGMPPGGPQAAQAAQGMIMPNAMTPQKPGEGNKNMLGGMLEHLQRMGGSHSLLTGVPSDVTGGGVEGFTPGRLTQQPSINGLGTSQSNLMNLIQPGGMWNLPTVSSGPMQMPTGQNWSSPGQAGAPQQGGQSSGEVKNESAGQAAGSNNQNPTSQGQASGSSQAGQAAQGQQNHGGQQAGSGGQASAQGGTGEGGEGQPAQGQQMPPLQQQGSLNPLSLALGQGGEGGFPAALQHQGSMTQLPGMQGLGAGGMLMPGAPGLLLRQGSIANAADLVRQNSNLGDLVRQNSLSWGMQGGAQRPELLRSDTELSFSMVW